MKRLLKNLNMKNNSQKSLKKKSMIFSSNGEVIVSVVDATLKEIIEESTPITKTFEINEELEGVLISKTEQTEKPISGVRDNKANNDITKDDYVKMLKLLRTPTFTEMLNVLSVKEAIIISLKLGYVDEKYFSTEAIAQFLGIEEEEVIDVTKKVLVLYKEKINDFLNNVIEIATDKDKKLSKR